MTFAISRLTAPDRVWTLPPGQAAFVERLALDAGGVLFCSMLGYALFLTFIGDEGVNRVRFMTEISLAKDLHEALVPPIDTTVAGLEVYGKALPSSEVGGDLLDLWHDGETVSVYVADVSGHGVTAGAMMGMATVASPYDDGIRNDSGRNRMYISSMNATLPNPESACSDQYRTVSVIRLERECVGGSMKIRS